MSDELVTLGEGQDADGKSRWISVRRAVSALVIPDGYPTTLEANEQVRVTQQLGDAFTVMGVRGQLFRIAGEDADALGRERPTAAGAPVLEPGKSVEDMVWEQLRTCFDPEIPVNIVDLGLIYGCAVTPLEDGASHNGASHNGASHNGASYKVSVTMTLTAPGCGMSGVLKDDVETKLRRIPGVKELFVDVTFDPPWSQERMSEAAKLELGML